MTFPKKIEDVPSYGHFNSEHGVVRYSEDIFVGYKHYQHKSVEPLWPFGHVEFLYIPIAGLTSVHSHGLSYTTFEYSDLKVGTPSVKDKNITVTLSFTITNTGSVPGQEVAQAYVSIPTQPDPAPHQVPRALRAFKKTAVLAPGEKATVELSLDKYAVSWWDERISSWLADKGKYGVQVGPSSAVLPLEGSFAIEKGFEWNGL
jgi:beta-glucosidase